MRDPNEKEHLIPDLKVSANVRDIFKWFREGLNLKEIANKLNSLEIKHLVLIKTVLKELKNGIMILLS